MTHPPAVQQKRVYIEKRDKRILDTISAFHVLYPIWHTPFLSCHKKKGMVKEYTLKSYMVATTLNFLWGNISK